MFEDESGVSLLPSVRATWAPRGHTPVLRHRFGWKRLSLAGALVYEPDGSDAHLVFELRPGAYNDETLIEFLTDVHHIEQRRMLLIWDGLPSHCSRRMLEWVASQRDWLSIEPLPGYAPDVNPIEQVWGNLKSTELANLCSDSISDVATSRTTVWTASAVTRHSVSLSSATAVYVCERQSKPAISQSSLECVTAPGSPRLLADCDFRPAPLRYHVPTTPLFLSPETQCQTGVANDEPTNSELWQPAGQRWIHT